MFGKDLVYSVYPWLEELRSEPMKSQLNAFWGAGEREIHAKLDALGVQYDDTLQPGVVARLLGKQPQDARAVRLLTFLAQLDYLCQKIAANVKAAPERSVPGSRTADDILAAYEKAVETDCLLHAAGKTVDDQSPLLLETCEFLKENEKKLLERARIYLVYLVGHEQSIDSYHKGLPAELILWAKQKYHLACGNTLAEPPRDNGSSSVLAHAGLSSMGARGAVVGDVDPPASTDEEKNEDTVGVIADGISTASPGRQRSKSTNSIPSPARWVLQDPDVPRARSGGMSSEMGLGVDDAQRLGQPRRLPHPELPASGGAEGSAWDLWQQSQANTDTLATRVENAI